MYLGALTAGAAVLLTLVAAAGALLAVGAAPPPIWVWAMLILGPPVLGAIAGVLVGRRFGTDIDDGGIRLVPGFTHAVKPWSRVVDLRAERRGARTVVSVYLESGEAVQLRAPYDGELLAADPQFELKLFALSHLWRSHRFGGLSS